MLGEPRPTPYDLNLKILGFHVRVIPWFWLVALLIGFGISQPEFVAYSAGQPTEFPTPFFLLLWMVAMFLSILIHELGHAIAFKYYGIASHIVLWHFGGLAVPDGMYGYTSKIHPPQQVVISLAGPAAQLLLAAVVLLLALASGHAIPVKGTLLALLIPARGEPIPNPVLHMFGLYLLVPSIFWALMNLLPVYPLDGGQVARNVLMMNNPATAIPNSLKLSIGVGGGVAVLGLLNGMTFLAILFGLLAVQSYMQLKGPGGLGGGGFGGGGGGRPW